MTNHEQTGTCPTCHGVRRIRIVKDLYRPDRDEPCPVCVGWPIATQPTYVSSATARPREGHVGKLVGALKACRSKFEDYAVQHYRKRTAEGDAKALANQQMATLCDDAIFAAEAASPVLLEGEQADV